MYNLRTSSWYIDQVIRATTCLLLGIAFIFAISSDSSLQARSFGELVMDIRDGKVYHTKNADKRLDPASLTKMMTLYLAFQALEEGRISPTTKVRISSNASSEPPSKMGWRTGQRVEFRYLIRATAIKSANDAATALAEALGGGSEAEFIRRMNATARSMGMTRTTFRNAHGLTHKEHKSTVRDMATLARHLYHDFPQYYHIFSRTAMEISGSTVYNTNRLFLGSYKGATGLKTGFTSAAGYNLAATAKKGDKHLVAVVFGGSSSPDRMRTSVRILDRAFKLAPAHTAVVKPKASRAGGALTAPTDPSATNAPPLTASLRPKARPDSFGDNSLADSINLALGMALNEDHIEHVIDTPLRVRPSRYATQLNQGELVIAASLSTAKRDWAVDIGGYYSKYDAQKAMLEFTLSEIEFLSLANREVRHTPTAWRAVFTEVTQQEAEQICARRSNAGKDCRTFPSG